MGAPNSACFFSKIAAMFFMVASEYTTPVGLLGELTITILVFAVSFASNSSSLGWKLEVSGDISTIFASKFDA